MLQQIFTHCECPNRTITGEHLLVSEQSGWEMYQTNIPDFLVSFIGMYFRSSK